MGWSLQPKSATVAYRHTHAHTQMHTYTHAQTDSRTWR